MFAAFLEKKIKMIVLVANVSASYGILLGRNFSRDVGGELNMDMIEAHIPVKGETKKLYPEKESQFSVVKSNDQRAQILFESSGVGNYFLHADDELKVVPEIEDAISLNEILSDCESIVAESMGSSTSQEEIFNFDTVSIGSLNFLWTLEFDGSCSSTGSGANIVLVSHDGQFFPSSFKLQFDNTNNTIEYESLLLGMNVS